MIINPNQYYRPNAPELRPIAAVQTLSSWRHLGKGPAYTLSGSRVLYLGSDLLSWLEKRRVNTVEPEAA